MNNLDVRPLFDEKTIAKRVKELGAQISKDYRDQDLVCVGVLKGSVIFLADLIRQICAPMSLEFIGVKSYEGTSSTGHVQITSDLTSEIKGKHVLLVEDIVDTGMTLDYLINTLKVREPKSVRICALLTKPDAHIMKHKIDYVGFEIANEFVIGYGLDLDGRHREMPYIGQVLSTRQSGIDE